MEDSFSSFKRPPLDLVFKRPHLFSSKKTPSKIRLYQDYFYISSTKNSSFYRLQKTSSKARKKKLALELTQKIQHLEIFYYKTLQKLPLQM